MPSHRTLIAIVTAGAAALVGVGAALFALTHDDTTPPATGELIAYSCKEQHNLPTALIVRPGSIFVMNADGSDERRLTRGWLDARPAWSPARSPSAGRSSFSTHRGASG